MGHNDHWMPIDQDTSDETINRFSQQLYRVADALCALRPSSEVGAEELAAGLLSCQTLKHPVLSADGQTLEDIPLPILGSFSYDPEIMNESSFTKAANLLFTLADHLSWFESDEEM